MEKVTKQEAFTIDKYSAYIRGIITKEFCDNISEERLFKRVVTQDRCAIGGGREGWLCTIYKENLIILDEPDARLNMKYEDDILVSPRGGWFTSYFDYLKEDA